MLMKAVAVLIEQLSRKA